MNTKNATSNGPVKRLTLIGAFVIFSVIALAGLGTSPPQATAYSEGETSAASFIVTFDESVVARPGRKVGNLEEQVGFESEEVFNTALEGFVAELDGQQVEELEDLESVVSVTPNFKVEKLGWQNRRRGDEVPAGVRRVGAADATRVRQAGAGVAVIDDGIDLNHPDLNARSGVNCSPASGSSSMPSPGASHGTHVAGTIGAKNNGQGVVGVAPGTPVYSVKIFDGPHAALGNILCGVDWVARNAKALGIEVVNMSLGYVDPEPSSYPAGKTCGTTQDPFRKAICDLRARTGVTVVVAAGNNAWPFDERPTLWSRDGAAFPAVYPEVITVTSMSDSDGAPGDQGPMVNCTDYDGYDDLQLDDWHTDFSNYAETPLGRSHTVAAPGACVKSTIPGGKYGYASGTSMAAPHVAGLMAACHSENGVPGRCADLTPDQVIDLAMWESRTLGQAAPGEGFTGDPVNPLPTSDWAHFGFLAPKPDGLPRPAEGYPKRHVPETGIDSVRKKKVGKRSLWKVDFKGYGLNAAYGTPLERLECQINRNGKENPWRSCRSGRVTARLGKGKHVIRVRAIADNGSIDPTPARQVVRLGR